jgi:hypothetical protein
MTYRLSGVLTCGLLVLSAGLCRAQTAPPVPDAAAEIAQLQASVPAAKPADVQSVEAIVAAIYAAISGPAGPRDWDRFRSLLLPEARFTASIVDAKGNHVVRRRSVDQYIERAGEYFASHPFYEQGLVTKVQRFGNIAQIFTSYESRDAPSGKPFDRGINSMQAMYDGSRWWIVSILWDDERPGNELRKAMRR